MSEKSSQYIEFTLGNGDEQKGVRRLRFSKSLGFLGLQKESENGKRLAAVEKAIGFGMSRIEALGKTDEEIENFNQERGAEAIKELAIKHAIEFLKDAFGQGLVEDNKNLREAVTMVMANLAETLYKKEGNVSDLESYAYTVHPFLKEHIEKVIYLATHDMLTEALNKFGLEWYISEQLDTIEAGLGIDLTNFKAINDKFGHQRGDDVLRDVTSILKLALRDDDVVARVGGDEFFAVLCDKTKDTSNGDKQHQRVQSERLAPEEVAKIAGERIAKELKAYLELEENSDLKSVGFDIAVGAVVWRKGVSTEILMAEADQAMWRHKDRQHEELGSYR